MIYLGFVIMQNFLNMVVCTILDVLTLVLFKDLIMFILEMQYRIKHN